MNVKTLQHRIQIHDFSSKFKHTSCLELLRHIRKLWRRFWSYRIAVLIRVLESTSIGISKGTSGGIPEVIPGGMSCIILERMSEDVQGRKYHWKIPTETPSNLGVAQWNIFEAPSKEISRATSGEILKIPECRYFVINFWNTQGRFRRGGIPERILEWLNKSTPESVSRGFSGGIFGIVLNEIYISRSFRNSS